MRTRHWAVLGLLALAGCHNDSKSAGRVCEDMLRQIADQAADCYDMTAPYALTSLHGMVSCREVADSVEAGRIAFDATKEQACQDAIAGLACGELQNAASSLPAACRDAFAPQVELHGECHVASSDVECITGGCFIDACNAPGTCELALPPPPPPPPPARVAAAAAKRVGEDCVLDEGECLDGAFCDTDSLKCAAWPRAGGLCGYPVGGEYRGCIDTYCEYVAAPPAASIVMRTGTCASYLKLGATCTDTFQCGPFAACDGDSMTCVAAYCPEDG